MVSEMTPMIEKLISERYLPDAVLERGRRTVRDLLALAGELPSFASFVLHGEAS
jgi:hypothetical protein